MSHPDREKKSHPDRETNRTRRPERTPTVVLLAAILMISGCGGQAVARVRPPTPTPTATPAAALEPTPSPTPVAPVAITYPRTGSEHWAVATGRGPVAGTKGRLLRYQVAVEKDVRGVDPDAFADTVEATLGNPRSWAAAGVARLQRVGPRSDPDFTVYLATPATRDQLCGDAAAGEVDRYTSCRNGDKVVLNVARWTHGVPDYGASLTVYRTYMVNHEVGHELGFGHELCPSAGRSAPVMQQQTLGLHGCRPNGWPNRRNGRPYHGPAGAYGDHVPKAS